MAVSCRIAFALSVIILGPCFAKEAVYLKSGFALEADSHTQQDEMLICRMGTGTLEFPVNEVARIEAIPDLAAPPAATVSRSSMIPEEILNRAAYINGLDENFVRSVSKV